MMMMMTKVIKNINRNELEMLLISTREEAMTKSKKPLYMYQSEGLSEEVFIIYYDYLQRIVLLLDLSPQAGIDSIERDSQRGCREREEMVTVE